MAKQTFTTGQVLSAAQVNALQANDYNTTVSTKTASYVLVAADVGTTIVQNVATANTVTVNTGLFAAGDTLRIQNIGAGIATITAGTATVNTANSLALPQWGSGILYFTSASASIFFPSAGAAAGGGKVLQVVSATYATTTTTTSTTYADTGLTATITPSLTSSKIMCLLSIGSCGKNFPNSQNTIQIQILRTATQIGYVEAGYTGTDVRNDVGSVAFNLLDVPASTSALTYKAQFKSSVSGAESRVQSGNSTSSILLIEIGA
jgi:hypothetical protein